MLFNLFNKKKTNTVNMNDYRDVYADSNTVILDSDNTITICSHEGVIACGEWNTTTKCGETKQFSNIEELFACYGIMDAAMQARIAQIIVDYAL